MRAFIFLKKPKGRALSLANSGLDPVWLYPARLFFLIIYVDFCEHLYMWGIFEHMFLMWFLYYFFYMIVISFSCDSQVNKSCMIFVS